MALHVAQVVDTIAAGQRSATTLNPGSRITASAAFISSVRVSAFFAPSAA